MRSFLQDIRYCVRMLGKSTAFTTVAVLILAVGIGANAVIFCVAGSILFPSLPYRDPDGILNLIQSHRISGGFAASIPTILTGKLKIRSFRSWLR
jgi:hypothetical protein